MYKRYASFIKEIIYGSPLFVVDCAIKIYKNIRPIVKSQPRNDYYF